jgi:hypothetical protein
MKRHAAYGTLGSAESEAAARFKSAWPRVRELFEDILSESWTARYRALAG